MKNKAIKIISRFAIPKTQQDIYRILLYHSIGKKDPADKLNIRISAEAFDKQMEYLAKENYKIFPLKDILEMVNNKASLPENSIAITFDDGYRDNLYFAVPILKKYNFTATLFLAVDYIEGEFTKEKDYWEEWSFLTWDEVRQLLKMGFDIGSHSARHVKNFDSRIDGLPTIIKKSKISIEKQIDGEIKLFSYPHGYFNKRLKTIVREAGFAAACSSLWGVNTFNTDLYELRRTEINSCDDLVEFQRKLQGRHDWRRYF